MTARPIITLLTDFGDGSHYVAAMKAVILNICPDTRIVDLCHTIHPQAIEEGAYLLSHVAGLFPDGTVHVAVVDPGVGTARRAIALRTAEGLFIGPDNGLLSTGIDAGRRPAAGKPGPIPVPIDGDDTALHLTNERYFRSPVSATFHGRDIFAPVAAHLASGVPIDEFGARLSEIQLFPQWRGVQTGSDTLSGRIVAIDRYGNCMTTIRGDDIPEEGRTGFTVDAGGHRFGGIHQTFQDGPDYLAYIGSADYLELAERDGDASRSLDLGIGTEVTVRHFRSA